MDYWLLIKNKFARENENLPPKIKKGQFHFNKNKSSKVAPIKNFETFFFVKVIGIEGRKSIRVKVKFCHGIMEDSCTLGTIR